MMTSTNRLYASTRALPAIAAVLAFSSTQALAQEAQPAPAPAPVTTPAPDEPAPSSDATSTVADTSESASQTTVKSTHTTKHSTQAAAKKPAPAASHTVTRKVTTQTTAPAVAAAVTPKPVAAAPAAPQSAVTPVVNYQPKPAPAQTTPAATNSLNLNGEALPIAGGALALLAIGGAAAAVTSRRRRRREQEWADAQTMSYEPFEEAAATPASETLEERAAAAPAASAFAWGNRSTVTPPANESAAGNYDRRPGETWVERAYRGPTPNNPSVSLRNRLKRAAFFDKREREAAAGLAEPVDANAGLPGAMAGERELA
jgi:hypothetical protein